MELTTSIVDTSRTFVSACTEAVELQELYNPDRFSFLFAFVLHPDFDRENYEYMSYCEHIRAHVFMEPELQIEYWTAVWVPTPGELFEMLLEVLTERRPKQKPTARDVITLLNKKATGAHTQSVSMHLLRTYMAEKHNRRYIPSNTGDGKWVTIK